MQNGIHVVGETGALRGILPSDNLRDAREVLARCNRRVLDRQIVAAGTLRGAAKRSATRKACAGLTRPYLVDVATLADPRVSFDGESWQYVTTATAMAGISQPVPV